MGLNFYGYDYVKPEPGTAGQPDARPIMGSAFLSVLRKHKPKLKWEEKFAEHRIKYKVSWCSAGSGAGIIGLRYPLLSIACVFTLLMP
jgi:hypothetical protein